jgi:hypothetical protein
MAFAAGYSARGFAADLALPAPDQVIADLEKRTFDFFWETTNPANGLVCDRWPGTVFASIAAVGFGLTAYPIGVERGYVTRAQAAERVLTTVRFLWDAPQGPQATGTAGYKGFFYHFLDMRTGTRIASRELSTVDTALLIAGTLFCRTYFDRSNAVEREIRELIDKIEARVDWTWAQPRAPAICHGWLPESGYLPGDWAGYCEAMLVYILALGSPTHPVGPGAWAAWCSTYDKLWGTLYGQEHLTFWCLFGHQYSHTWIDFRGIRDPYMHRKDLDYFENSRRAVYAQRAYARLNPKRWKGYGENIWGMTGSDGPADVLIKQAGGNLNFNAYAARGIGIAFSLDDGTIAPTAAIASIAFAPEIALPTVQQIFKTYGELIYAKYGFLDAFNPSFDYDVPLLYGRRVPGFGWVDVDYLGSNLGPSIAMIENHRSDLVWSTMRRHPTIRRGLHRAGFSGGWLDKPAARTRQA